MSRLIDESTGNEIKRAEGDAMACVRNACGNAAVLIAEMTFRSTSGLTHKLEPVDYCLTHAKEDREAADIVTFTVTKFL